MHYWKKTKETDKELFDGISVVELAKFSKIAQPTLSNVKNGKQIISEKFYKKIKSSIEKYRNLK